MSITRHEAEDILQNEIKSELERAAYASLKGKISTTKDFDLPKYIDDYKNVSEEERFRIWGITGIDH